MKKTAVLTGGDAGAVDERDGEKERRKKEKKERKEREKRERMASGLEEPLRLEEVSRFYMNFFRGNRHNPHVMGKESVSGNTYFYFR